MKGNEKINYAKVIVSISNKQVDRAFTYKVPEELAPFINKGARVVVPFGRSNKKYEGYVVSLSDRTSAPENFEIKEIISLLDTMFTPEMLALAKWMSDKYFTPYSECLKCIMPAGISYKNSYIYEINQAIPEKATLRQKEIYDYISDRKEASHQDIIASFGANASNILNGLIKNKIIVKKEKQTMKDLARLVRYAALSEKVSKESIRKGTAQEKAYDFLLEKGETPVKALKESLGITDSPIQSLVKKGIVKLFEKEVRRETARPSSEVIEKNIIWNDEQREAIERIKALMKENESVKRPVLIHGVTGSGKTEVYMSIIEEVLKEGKEAIVLVPEISLTPQTVGRFVDRFGEKVSVTHSRLTMAERYDQWKNAAEGKVSVMIGPRSAVFTPFHNLGIIIIDEEHEHTYKSETSPKYDAREIAFKRGEISNALVVLGSATPSVDTYFKAENKEYELIHMRQRVKGEMPQVDIIDMRKELVEGNRSIFSRALYEAMKENIEKGRQTILFLNRRGHSTFVSCRQCGYVVKCEDCSINYTYHLYSNKLICHYCGKEEQNPEYCPQCGSKYIRYFGVGTQKIEDEIKSLFPDVPVLRMDMDTTSGKNSHDKILSAFRKGKAKILIGTQMIAKGLDFPNVTLVGVVAADVSLNAGDYKSGENTFQLLTQVSGRAGRGDGLGKVFIQTYSPEHYALEYAKTGDYEGFYSHEIALRRQMDYPPYCHIFTVLFTGESEKKVIELLFKLSDIMKVYNKSGDFEALGPAPALISKIKKRFRWKIIIKCKDEERLKNYVLYCVEKLREKEDLEGINVNLTLDPLVSV